MFASPSSPLALCQRAKECQAKGYRCCSRAARGRRSAEQSRREFASAVSATRTRDAALSKSEDAAEVQLSSRPGAQPIQSGAASRHPAGLQAETLDCIGGVARPCKVRRRLRAGVSRYASANAVTPTTPPARSNAPSLCGRGSGPNNTLGACSWHSFPRTWTSDV
jgi:hypothetical protein